MEVRKTKNNIKYRCGKFNDFQPILYNIQIRNRKGLWVGVKLNYDLRIF